MITWEQIYNFFGISDFIYFISSPTIQEMLFPVKIIFILFTIFFFCCVVYFLNVSSYLKFQFLEDVTEFFSWQAYGLKEIAKKWKKIQKRAESGSEAELKLAIIEADDFLSQVLDERGFEGKTFVDLIDNAGRIILPNYQEILDAHKIRNSVVYDADFTISQEDAKRVLSVFELAIKNVGSN